MYVYDHLFYLQLALVGGLWALIGYRFGGYEMGVFFLYLLYPHYERFESEMNGGMIRNGPGSGAPGPRDSEAVEMKQKQ